MNKSRLIHIFCALCLAGLLAACTSQKAALKAPAGMDRELKAAGLNVDPLQKGQSEKWLRELASTYKSWQKLSMEGKLALEKLPIDPTVKIYMERGNLVILSGRVPLMGEMVRLEIDQDSALLVNKYDKTYAKVSTASLLNRIGVNLTDFQDLLLGRVFLAGSAPLSRDNVSLFQVSAAVGGNYIVTPKVQRNDCEYGFTLYPDGKMFLAAAFTTDDKYLLQSEYSYIKDKTALEISATVGKKAYGGTLTLSAPNYSPKPLERIKVNSAWKRTTLKGLFEALK